MTECKSDYLNNIPADVYQCNSKVYSADEMITKLINILLQREGGYNLYDKSSVSGETYRGIDRKNGDENKGFWELVDAKKDLYILNGHTISDENWIPTGGGNKYSLYVVTYEGTHVTDDYKKKYGNYKIMSNTIFENESDIKNMAIDIYKNKYYTPKRINELKSPMIAGHTLSQCAHYGSGKDAWLKPLINAINAVYGTDIPYGRVLTDRIIRYANGNKACQVAEKYTQFRREQYAKSKQTQYIEGWLNMVNGWVKGVNAAFK